VPSLNCSIALLESSTSDASNPTTRWSPGSNVRRSTSIAAW